MREASRSNWQVEPTKSGKRDSCASAVWAVHAVTAASRKRVGTPTGPSPSGITQVLAAWVEASIVAVHTCWLQSRSGCSLPRRLTRPSARIGGALGAAHLPRSGKLRYHAGFSYREVVRRPAGTGEDPESPGIPSPPTSGWGGPSTTLELFH
jgi:hypothetical protein